MRSITLAGVEYVSFQLARETMDFHEPIPPFTTRYPNILESCLLTPFQSFDKKHLYKGLIGKASILFYLMIKNHPFQNGNKRIAMTTLFTFLALNKKWLSVDGQKLYNFALWVSSSPAEYKEETVGATEKFIRNHMISLK